MMASLVCQDGCYKHGREYHVLIWWLFYALIQHDAGLKQIAINDLNKLVDILKGSMHVNRDRVSALVWCNLASATQNSLFSAM